jgi:hypothetical protein
MTDRIYGYAFEADAHCVPCTQKATQRMKLDHNHPYAMGESCKDDQGVEYDLVDREGNLIHPLFTTDAELHTHCGDCRGEIS